MLTPSKYSVITPESNVSPGLALAKKINGSLTSKLSVPVVVNVPLTVKSPTQVMSPPMFKLPTMPAPPATVNAPVVTLPLLVALVMVTAPLVLTLPVAPIPPATVNAPVTLLVDATLLLKVTRFAPATVMTIVVAFGQYIPVLLAATEYTLGAPTVPAPNALAVRFRELSAPAR